MTRAATARRQVLRTLFTLVTYMCEEFLSLSNNKIRKEREITNGTHTHTHSEEKRDELLCCRGSISAAARIQRTSRTADQ